MKKILILAYDFPPYISVGAQRPYYWYRYFREFGIDPIVISRQWNSNFTGANQYVAAGYSDKDVVKETEFGILLEAPYKPNLANRLYLRYGEKKFRIIRKIISGYYEIIQWYLPIGSKIGIYKTANTFLKGNKVDAIIATGDPFILFRYASQLSKKFNIPWIADYRDPWIQYVDPAYIVNSLLRSIYLHCEKKYLKNVTHVTIVSNAFEELIIKNIPVQNITVIPNGFDSDVINEALKVRQNSEYFTVTYIGRLYKYYPIDSFLSALNQFIKSTPLIKIRLQFIGISGEFNMKDFEQKYPEVFAITQILPPLPISDLFKQLAASNILLLFNMYSILGTKIYDYIAINRKILMCYSNDDSSLELKNRYFNIESDFDKDQHAQEKLILDKNAGIIVKDKDHLHEVLKDLYKEFSETGQIACQSKSIDEYSRRSQTKKLAELIRNNILVSEKKYQQCKRCVMDTSDAKIEFDASGNCNHCTDYFENTSKRIYQGKTSNVLLQNLVEKIKKSGRKNKYDCVIGISGGVDSIYAAYMAKSQGLRALCVHMDNGWNSEIAVNNIEKILKKINYDLYTYVLDWTEFKDLQLSFLKASVPEAETPTDIAIPAVLHQVAAKHGIKFILSGGNYATEGILPKSWHYDAKDVKYLKAIQQKFGTKKLKTFPTFGFKKEFYYKYFKGIRMCYPLNYLPYNKKEAIRVLEEELDWKNYGGKHHESLYTKFVQSYYLFEKFGIDYRRATFSTQICAGEMTREEALQELTKKPYNSLKLEEEKEYIRKKFDISMDDLNHILNLPPKCFEDYPNSRKKLEFIYSVYRMINK